MNTDTDGHDPERKMFIPTNFYFLQMLVIQDTVIYLFTRGVFAINGFVFGIAQGKTVKKPK